MVRTSIEATVLRKQSFRTIAVSGILVLATAGIAVAENDDVVVTLVVDCPASVTAPAPFDLDYVDSVTGSSTYRSAPFDVAWDPGCGSGTLEADIGSFTSDPSETAEIVAAEGGTCANPPGTLLDSMGVVVSNLGADESSTESLCLVVRIPDDTPDGTYTATLSFTVLTG